MMKLMTIPSILLTGLLTITGLAAELPKTAPRVVFMIGEDEYKTWETLPEFAKSTLEPLGIKTTVIHADAKEKNSFPGLAKALREADLLFVSVRRRTPPKEELEAVRAHLNAGKPLIGIRTACHAFALRPNEKLPENSNLAQWTGFDPEVLGGSYTGHHGDGPKTTIKLANGATEHPILKAIELSKLIGNGSLYKVAPLDATAQPLLIGSIPEKPAEPVAWTRLYGSNKARVFYTSLGHPDDFQNAEFRRLLVNAIFWAANQPRPVTRQ
jgi:type 1 glutamine amidotransferase